MTPTCANYFLGLVVGCDGYPSPDDIIQAPSVCLEEWGTYAKRAAGDKGLPPYPAPTDIFLNKDNSQLAFCQLDCYGTYETAALTYFNTCAYNPAFYTQNSTKPGIAQLYAAIGLQQYRGMSCQATGDLFDATSKNCFDGMKDSINQVPGPLTPFMNDWTCQTLAAYPASVDITVTQFAGALCPAINDQLGCCASTDFTQLLPQATGVNMPPCLSRMLLESCPVVGATPLVFSAPCTDGNFMGVSTVTLQGHLVSRFVAAGDERAGLGPAKACNINIPGIGSLPCATLPNMYSDSLVAPFPAAFGTPAMQQIIGGYINGTLASLGIQYAPVQLGGTPYAPAQPFPAAMLVMVTDFTYSNDTGPTDPGPIPGFPTGSQCTDQNDGSYSCDLFWATTLDFTAQITVATESAGDLTQILAGALSQPAFATFFESNYLPGALPYTLDAGTTTFTVTGVSYTPEDPNWTTRLESAAPPAVTLTIMTWAIVAIAVFFTAVPF